MLVMVTTGAFAEMVFNRGNSADPESLDPHKTSTVYEAAYSARSVFRPDDAGRQSRIIPGAAESWTVCDDGKVYTFKLRAGATWSNGSPVTADDFVFSLQRVEDPATAAEYASMLCAGRECRGYQRGQEKARRNGREGCR